ncbi:exonuclease domain-containing protein [Planctomonas psychrotolerans]|uniref:exonuclease domain-containing protein n=1 Tax=Planctomonas psychrotolerans TaxID=2528712 RepID=UPI00123C4C0B|nr:exonuclease domain-containing protein [Planctomonas psychrotolerans]
MPLNFTAIDFETANSSSASACSVGLVKVRAGRVVDRAGWLIRPPVGHDDFLEWNTRIHGIRASDVIGAAGWAQQLPDLLAFADGDPFVAHNAGFDMGVIAGGCAASGTPCPDLSYLCTLQVARKTYELDSYRLPVAAMAAGFEDFAHHDALADAEACAAILVHAARRHDAESVSHLAELVGLRVGWMGQASVDAKAVKMAARLQRERERSVELSMVFA